MTQSEIKLINISLIRLDGDTQSREKLDEQTVTAYADRIEAGDEFPPADVFSDDKDFWMGDGFHQIVARKKLGQDRIPCRVHNGTRDDARWFSYAANQAHGLRRTNADKRKAVLAALKHPNGATMSDPDIAKHVGVSDKTVAKYRTELEASSEIPKMEKRTVTRNGKTYEQNTANIGAKPKATPKAAEPEPEAIEPGTNAHTPPGELDIEPDRFCSESNGPLGQCGCVTESPVVAETGPPDAPCRKSSSAAAKRKAKQKYPVSDRFDDFLGSIVGFSEMVKRQHGTTAKMLSHPEWDPRETKAMIGYARALKEFLIQFEKDLVSHDASKTK